MWTLQDVSTITMVETWSLCHYYFKPGHCLGGRVNVVTVTMVWGRWFAVRSPRRVRDFSFSSKCPDQLWGPIWSPALCVLGVMRPVSRNEVRGEWKILTPLFWVDSWMTYEQFYHFYLATGWIYCADAWMLFQNSLQLMFYCVWIRRYVAITSDVVTLLFLRCDLAIHIWAHCLQFQCC